LSDEKTIFAGALAIAVPEERQAFLDRACEGDASLRAEVEALLAAYERGAASFLESPPSGLAATVAATDADLAGATIGPYKLLERIGEGGMGVVYMAEQLRPVKRRVALKIIKPGLDTKQVTARALRSRAPGAGDDGSSLHRQGLRRWHDRHRPALLRDGVGRRRPADPLLR
jgi:serine/threonine protein kinase